MFQTFFYISGGLASPPNTRNNSPLMPNVSSSGPNSQKFHRLQLINHRNLHDSLDSPSSAVDVEKHEEDDIESELSLLESLEMEVEFNPLTTPESKKAPSISWEEEEEEDVVDSKKPLEDSPDVESGKLVLEASEGDHGDHMVSVESRNPLSESEDVQGMVGVELVKDDKEGHDTTWFHSKLKLSDSPDDPEADAMPDASDDEGEPNICDPERDAMKMSEFLQEAIVGDQVDSMEISDLSEDDEEQTITTEEDPTMVGVELDKMSLDSGPKFDVAKAFGPRRTSPNDSSEEPTIATEVADAMVDIELNKMSLDSDSYVDIATPFEPCRSSRNAAAKNMSYPNATITLKYFNGKRKRGFEKDDVIEVRASDNVIQ